MASCGAQTRASARAATGSPRAATGSRQPYQLFQVLFREPRVQVPLLLELVARRLRDDRDFPRFEALRGRRRGDARGGVEGPRSGPGEQTDSPQPEAHPPPPRETAHPDRWDRRH